MYDSRSDISEGKIRLLDIWTMRTPQHCTREKNCCGKQSHRCFVESEHKPARHDATIIRHKASTSGGCSPVRPAISFVRGNTEPVRYFVRPYRAPKLLWTCQYPRY